jgi:hypothetical protein
MSTDIKDEEQTLITRREAILRVTALMGGVALIGGTAMLTGCKDTGGTSGATDSTSAAKPFTTDDVAFLDEVADTILPTTKTPGAKAAKTGAFMALMVTDSYSPGDAKIFRDGMKALDDASKKANNVGFMAATPAQRLALLQTLDQEQKTQSDKIDADRRADAEKRRQTTAPAVPDTVKAAQPNASDAHLPDQRKENAPPEDATTDTYNTAGLFKAPPHHYFRMMKELALLGYFTSEIGCKQAQHYAETPGRYDPCLPYTKGDPAWAGHA